MRDGKIEEMGKALEAMPDVGQRRTGRSKKKNPTY